MLNTYFERIVPLLEANGGEVHQIVGDEVMAIFNKQGDTPDHPERAALAALRLQAEAERIAAAHPEWPRFRTGVNSGDVVSRSSAVHAGTASTAWSVTPSTSPRGLGRPLSQARS